MTAPHKPETLISLATAFLSVYFSPSALPLSGQLSKAGSSRGTQPTLGGLGAGVRSRATPRLRACPPVRRDALWGARVSAGAGVESEVGGQAGKGALGSAHFSTVRLANPPKLNDTELAREAVKKQALSHIASGNPKSYEPRGGEFSNRY